MQIPGRLLEQTQGPMLREVVVVCDFKECDFQCPEFIMNSVMYRGEVSPASMWQYQYQRPLRKQESL